MSKRANAYRTGETFVQAARPEHWNYRDPADHAPRRECSTYEHTCHDCDAEIRGMEPCWKATVNGRSRWWHLPCLPDAMAP